MTPTDFRATIARLDLTQTKAARLLGVDPRTVRRWCGTQDAPEPVRRLLLCLERVDGVRTVLERLA